MIYVLIFFYFFYFKSIYILIWLINLILPRTSEPLENELT